MSNELKNLDLFSPEQQEIFKNITILIPDNDGEAHQAIEISQRLGLDVRISKQPWGATLDQELKDNTDIFKHAKNKVLIFEMPGLENEEKLSKNGLNIDIIDHHQYSGLDRSQPKSSLEQLLHKLQLTDSQLLALGFDPKFVRGIGINDRAYIYGLRKAGYSEDEIKKIRDYDLKAQFKDNYKELMKLNKDYYQNRQIIDDLIILRTKKEASASAAHDKIAFDFPDRIPQIINFQTDKENKLTAISFNGPAEIVANLKQSCPPTYASSSQGENESCFCGWINPTGEQIRLIKKYFKQSEI